MSKLFEHPFDLVKVRSASRPLSRLRTAAAALTNPPTSTQVRLQSQPLDKPFRYKGPLDCFVQTFKGEGLRGLWRVRTRSCLLPARRAATRGCAWECR